MTDQENTPTLDQSQPEQMISPDHGSYRNTNHSLIRPLSAPQDDNHPVRQSQLDPNFPRQLSLPLSDNQTVFEMIKHPDGKDGYWLARELMAALGYSSWQYFKPVISRAKKACKNSGHKSRAHFMPTHSDITTKQGAVRKVADMRLSRYACYLVAMNADPDKPIVAEAQTYFAVQTRRQELSVEAKRIERHNQDVVAYQMRGQSHDWAEARVDSKESQKRLNATLAETHEQQKPDYRGAAAEQNQGLFEMTRREIVAYLGLLPSQEPQYRDFLGKYAQMAVKDSNSVIVDRIKALGRDLSSDEQLEIVRFVTRKIAPFMRELAAYAHVDYLSGAPLDETGRALIVRNVRLLKGG